MESVYKDKTFESTEISGRKVSGTTEEFQNFITKLFEKNGVLHDLRAYLRGHIFTVLKNVENGEFPYFQKHFTQRLEHKYQAMNVILTEYLKKMEFNYSLSVFISEIPLANMVFDFTKALFDNPEKENTVRFSENDVWSILNYLGLNYDTQHGLKIIEDYGKGEDPLLLCILKHTPLYTDPDHVEGGLSEGNLSSSTAAPPDVSRRRTSRRCKHYFTCKTCKSRVAAAMEKYKMKKKRIPQIFEQIRGVYEEELESLREKQEEKMRRSIACHAEMLQRHREKLEEELRERQSQMDANIERRKHFVKGMAASLRDAHMQLLSERRRLKGDANGLAERENNLKSQVQEAAETIRSKGEKMRALISDELSVLDERMRLLRREREDMDTKREELEIIRKSSDVKLLNKYSVDETENLIKQWETMKNQLEELKKYVEVPQESTSGDIETEEKIKNNEQVSERNDERLKKSQVVNDLKKLKNVNVCQTQATVRKWSDTGTHECVCGSIAELMRLREENERMKEFAHQQSSHIKMLTFGMRQQSNYLFQSRLFSPTLSETTFTLRLEDEQKKEWAETDEEIMCAKDSGTRDPAVSRRHFDQWRDIRRRVSYVDSCDTVEVLQEAQDEDNELVKEDPEKKLEEEALKQHQDGTRENRSEIQTEINTAQTKDRDSITQSEIREKLRQKMKESMQARGSSPKKMFKEAKMRLRKLEIEAEAVERSYMNYRKRKADESKLILNDESQAKTSDPYIGGTSEQASPKGSVQTLLKSSKHAFLKKYNGETKTSNSLDYDKYLREYDKMDSSNVTYKNRNTAMEKIKPIPNYYREIDTKISEDKCPAFFYLEKPLLEFRKLYQSDISRPIIKNNIQTENINKIKESRKIKIKNKELQISPSNYKQIYNLNPQEISYSGNNIVKDHLNSNDNIQLKCPPKDISSSVKTDDIEVIEKAQELSEKDIERNDCNKEDVLVINSTPRDDVANTPKIKTEDMQLRPNTPESPINITSSFIEPKIVVTTCEMNKRNSKEESLVEDIKQKSLYENISFYKVDSNNSNEPKHVTKNNTTVKLCKESENICLESIGDEKINGNCRDNTETVYADDFFSDVNNHYSLSEFVNNSSISCAIQSEDDVSWQS